MPRNIAKGSEHRREVIIKKGEDHAVEDDPQVGLCHFPDFSGNLQKVDNGINKKQHAGREEQCQSGNKEKGKSKGGFQIILFFRAVTHGKGNTASHTKPQYDRG